MDIALALILHPTERKILIARRRQGTHLAEFWEFPGGKIEPGETASECVVREAKEEVGLDVVPREMTLEPVTFRYPERSVTLYPVLCQADSDEAEPLESDSVLWVGSHDLRGKAFPPANEPIIAWIKNFLDQPHGCSSGANASP